jgi:hypothetical protein
MGSVIYPHGDELDIIDELEGPPSKLLNRTEPLAADGIDQ